MGCWVEEHRELTDLLRTSQLVHARVRTLTCTVNSIAFLLLEVNPLTWSWQLQASYSLLFPEYLLPS